MLAEVAAIMEVAPSRHSLLGGVRAGHSHWAPALVGSTVLIHLRRAGVLPQQ